MIKQVVVETENQIKYVMNRDDIKDIIISIDSFSDESIDYFIEKINSLGKNAWLKLERITRNDTMGYEKYFNNENLKNGKGVYAIMTINDANDYERYQINKEFEKGIRPDVTKEDFFVKDIETLNRKLAEAMEEAEKEEENGIEDNEDISAFFEKLRKKIDAKMNVKNVLKVSKSK